MSKKIVSDFYARDSYEMPKSGSDKKSVIFSLGNSVSSSRKIIEINDKKNFKIKDRFLYIKPHKEVILDFDLWAGLPKGYILVLDLLALHAFKDLVVTSDRVLQGDLDHQIRVFVKVYNTSSKTVKLNMAAPTLIGRYYKCNMKPLKIADLSVSSGGFFEDFKSQVLKDNAHLLKRKDVNINDNNEN